MMIYFNVVMELIVPFVVLAIAGICFQVSGILVNKQFKEPLSRKQYHDWMYKKYPENNWIPNSSNEARVDIFDYYDDKYTVTHSQVPIELANQLKQKKNFVIIGTILGMILEIPLIVESTFNLI